MSKMEKIIGSYSISTSQQDILAVMVRSANEERSILWQTHGRHRTIYPVNTLDVNLAKKVMTVTFSTKAALLDPELPVYIKLSFRETVFKGEILQVKGGQLTAHLPSEVHWREFRELGRISFTIGERFVIVRPHVAHLRADQLPTLKVTLRDITEKGMGLAVSSENAAFFKTGKFIELVSLGNEGLMRSLLAEVRWVKRAVKKEEKSQGLDWLVGVRMIDTIPAFVLDAFTLGGRAHRNAMDMLIHSDVLTPAFHEMLKLETAKTLKKMKTRPAIAKYLQQLEIVRGKDEYLAEHIEVLMVVCTFIARALNWVSEVSLEKFIYAAYMHDAPLFAHPRLAPLRNKMELESRRAQLADEEIRAYLDAPAEAMRLVEADSSAPPDVAQMMALQKEMPDGSGFPLGISSSKISPMAAVFIVAHALADEIMLNPKWEIKSWLTQAKKVYKGGHFTKVIQSLDDIKVTFKKR